MKTLKVKHYNAATLTELATQTAALIKGVISRPPARRRFGNRGWDWVYVGNPARRTNARMPQEVLPNAEPQMGARFWEGRINYTVGKQAEKKVIRVVVASGAHDPVDVDQVIIYYSTDHYTSFMKLADATLRSAIIGLAKGTKTFTISKKGVKVKDVVGT